MATRTHRRWFGSRSRNNNLCSLLQNPCFLPQTLKMVTTQAASKRPICPSCSKPARLCLCSRIQNPGLHNSFVIRPLDSVSQMGSDRNGLKSLGFDEVVESRKTQKLDFEYCDGFSSGEENVGKLGFGLSANLAEERNNSSLIDCEKCNFGSDLGDMSSSRSQLGDVDFVEKEHEFSSEDFTDGIHVDGQCNVDEVSASTALDALSEDSDVGFDAVEGIERGNGDPVITATIGKHGVISSLSHNWMPQTCCKDLKFDTILDIADARGALSEGFVVRKLQKQPLKGSVELDEYVEFEVEVPPGSVLLFPSEEAVSVGDLEAMDIKVKNLIVLDGTWSKAKRMYGENPWLKLLPHLKLNVEKMSLYSEVRLQPKPGFLSTIESIVYALKAVGDSPGALAEGLDNLLDVFRSMVEDQIRCKEERLSNVSPE
ncbi:uncharacterized protein LOC103966996 [Pyrus x bretschneideri]|uniref:uncharacterized protein LOC103966996 n=1 Tax=Pyrus x bretschneideri TaxID=225117 RepID=UPI00202EBB68|nr:uncharacterized protein LOC103966996 [Pyrus x bretschneideri]